MSGEVVVGDIKACSLVMSSSAEEQEDMQSDYVSRSL